MSRSVNPVEAAVLSVTRFHAGEATNVIADRAEIAGTVRTLAPGVRDLIEKRMGEVVDGIAAAHGATIRLDYRRNYPVTRNHASAVDFAADIATEIVGEGRVDTDVPPLMGGEDFAYMLEKRPGAMIFLGNGDSAGLHNPAYDFNDEAIAYGCSYWVRLVERGMPANPER